MDFLEALERFNRKERFFLVAYALGNPTFALDRGFARTLGDAAQLSIPADTISYMDYHLDWIQAAAHISGPCDCTNGIHSNPDGDDRRNHGNQEDIDLVVAFRQDGVARIVLVEAKGDGAWDMAQLRSKGKRLRAAFGEHGRGVPGVIPTFVKASRNAPPRAVPDEWPKWMTGSDGRAPWIKLPWGKDRLRVTGCDRMGVASKSREYFAIR